MSYFDICILGWNLNALMFFINFLIAIKTISGLNHETLKDESLILKDLKEELDKYYPNKTMKTIISYITPFTAFFRMLFRFIEMLFFFQKNKGAKMFDYMVYKYTNDINKMKNNR